MKNTAFALYLSAGVWGLMALPLILANLSAEQSLELSILATPLRVLLSIFALFYQLGA